jgi:hypothetical protein
MFSKENKILVGIYFDHAFEWGEGGYIKKKAR